MENGNGNGNGDCIECRNGDWYCPPENGHAVEVEKKLEEGCPEALKQVQSQDQGGYKEIGTVWLPIDLFRDHGFTIFAKVDCSDPKDPTVGLYLKRVIRESAKPKLP